MNTKIKKIFNKKNKSKVICLTADDSGSNLNAEFKLDHTKYLCPSSSNSYK